MDEDLRRQFAELATEWIIPRRSAADLDPLQGHRWNHFRELSGQQDLPIWEKPPPSRMPPLSGATLRAVALDELTDEERAAVEPLLRARIMGNSLLLRLVKDIQSGRGPGPNDLDLLASAPTSTFGFRSSNVDLAWAASGFGIWSLRLQRDRDSLSASLASNSQEAWTIATFALYPPGASPLTLKFTPKMLDQTAEADGTLPGGRWECATGVYRRRGDRPSYAVFVAAASRPIILARAG